MERLKRAMKRFGTAMAAAAFAEEGEPDTARTLVREERRVLLAVKEGRIDGKTFRYAVNTCRRIGADLDILYVSAGQDADPALEQCLSGVRQAGIPYRLQKGVGSLEEAVIAYTNARKEVLFAVIGTEDNREADGKGKGKKHAGAWQGLRCPLVVVAENG